MFRHLWTAPAPPPLSHCRGQVRSDTIQVSTERKERYGFGEQQLGKPLVFKPPSRAGAGATGPPLAGPGRQLCGEPVGSATSCPRLWCWLCARRARRPRRTPAGRQGCPRLLAARPPPPGHLAPHGHLRGGEREGSGGLAAVAHLRVRQALELGAAIARFMPGLRRGEDAVLVAIERAAPVERSEAFSARPTSETAPRACRGGLPLCEGGQTAPCRYRWRCLHARRASS